MFLKNFSFFCNKEVLLIFKLVGYKLHNMPKKELENKKKNLEHCTEDLKINLRNSIGSFSIAT
jgi:hypothetical protein